MIRISAYQGRCSDDFGRNMEKVLEVIDKAGQDNCDFLCFPEGYDVTQVDGVGAETGPYCDGALGESMSMSEEGHALVIKFRRTDIEAALGGLDPPQRLDTSFTVTGTFAHGTAEFEATDRIREVVDH